MARDFTDAELRQVAEFVARRYLEVERGLRGKQCLRRFLSPQAYDRQGDPAASRFGKSGVVRQTDLGRMSFQRPQPDRAYVAIPARQQGDRWGALVMELRADARGVWRVTELTRAQDRNLARPQPVPEWKGPGDPDLALAELAGTTLAARTARTAAAERHARARQDLARVAAEKPAAELVPGDLLAIRRLPSRRLPPGRGCWRHDVTVLPVASSSVLRREACRLSLRPVDTIVSRGRIRGR